MYTDSTLQPIEDGHQYISQDGTQYPGDFPKSSIGGLFAVTMTAQPTDPSLVVTGFTIDDTHTQVWETRPKTEDELKNDIKAQIRSLEAQQTPRRIREALKDPTFLNTLDAEIAVLRNQL